MLVLSRKSLESVVVERRDADEHLLTVTVLEVCGSRVRLGFKAGDDIAIHRTELWEKIRANGADQLSAGPIEDCDAPFV